jgi:competence protein ComEC
MRRHRLFAVAVLVAAVAAGFATATFRTARIAHTVLMRPLYSVALSVFVEARDIREKTDRFVLRATTMESPRGQLTLERVRLAVKKGTAPDVGSFVELKARLMPPLAPLRAGSYDFARDLYLRDAIDARILTRLDRDERAIATALLTGRRDAITEPVNDAMFISGLGHVLSISGYHMAVVAGVVFFVVRALLALVPALTIGIPIKKWAAAAALGASAFYLLLSGAEVATQRSFYMTAVVLIAVIADRRAITFRTLALVAMIVLVIAPEALVHPSF